MTLWHPTRFESRLQLRAVRFLTSLKSGGYFSTDKKFTGRQGETFDDLGLYDYGARFHSAVLGRFLSPDSLVVKPGDAHMLDCYAYVRNNPPCAGRTTLEPQNSIEHGVWTIVPVPLPSLKPHSR